MALSGSGLKAAIEAEFAPETPLDDARLQKFCDAVINYLVANAVILPDTFVVADPDSGTLPVTGTGELS